MPPAEQSASVRHPDDLLDLFRIDDAAATGGETADRELPLLSDAPRVIEWDRIKPLDPGRLLAQARERPSSESRARAAPFGIAGSLAIHLLPFLLLLNWHSKTMELPRPIPVRLVIQRPPPEPGRKHPQPARLASEDIGEKVPKSGRGNVKPVQPAAAETKTAAIAPPPPAPAPKQPAPPEPQKAAVPPTLTAPDRKAPLVPPPPEKPAAPIQKAVLRHPPQPSWLLPVPRPVERRVASRRAAPNPRDLPYAGEVPGLAAIRDQYLAYLRVLTLRYLRTVSPAFLGGRSGSMALTIRVLGDGTIARIAVANGSGYADIDSRFEQIIGSIGHFPPLPPYYPADSADLTLSLRFPDALE